MVKQAGMPERGRPETLRQPFAIRPREDGDDSRTGQDILGSQMRSQR
jgi:hypothetical protein